MSEQINIIRPKVQERQIINPSDEIIEIRLDGVKSFTLRAPEDNAFPMVYKFAKDEPDVIKVDPGLNAVFGPLGENFEYAGSVFIHFGGTTGNRNKGQVYIVSLNKK